MNESLPPIAGPRVRPLAAAVQAWNRFWFEPADPTPLGLIRIVTGLLVFYVVLAYTVDLQELFGVDAWVNHQGYEKMRHDWPWVGRGSGWEDEPAPYKGEVTPADREYMREWPIIHPRQTVARGKEIWSVWFHVTDPTWMAVTHATILLIIGLFTLGVATRVTSVLTWLGVVSYTQRAPTTLFGMDTMMNLLLIYLMVAPSGAALSVDRLIARYWATWRALRARRPAPARLRPAPLMSANLALRLLQVNLCIIYLASGLSKLQGVAWWRGQAIWGTLANYEFSPMHFGPFVALMKFLCENRWLWEICMTTGVAFTLIMEIGFPFLIWVRPLRWVFLGMAVMLHTGIAVFMGLNTFSLMMLGLLLSFVPVETIRWVLDALGRGAPRLALAFNGRARAQVRAVSVVRAFDFWDQVEPVESAAARRLRGDAEAPAPSASLPARSDGDHLRLTTEKGEVVTGFALFDRLVSSVRGLWPLVPVAWLLRVTGLGPSRYPGDRDASVPAVHTDNGRRHEKGEKVVR